MRRLTLTIAAVLLLSACADEPVPIEEMTFSQPPIKSTPLPVDPTDRIEVVGWWAGRTQLLRLDAEESYAFYDSPNRYRPPAHHGRWSRINYAALRLEPYTRLQREPVRIEVRRVGERFALVIDGGPPMYRTDRPLPAPEDRLIGRWEAGTGMLSVTADGRYRFSPAAGSEGAVGHGGAWRVDGERLIIDPDTPGIRGLTLTIRRSGETITLEAADATFRPATAPAGE